MNCQAFEPQLGDYVDGALSGPARAALDAHLAGCERCRALIADLNTIRAMASTLPLAMPPPAVWARLETAVRPARRRSRPAAFLQWQPLATAAMVIVIAGSLWWVGDRLHRVGSSDRAARPVRFASGAVTFTDTAQASAEAHYTSTIAALERMTATERQALDSATAGALDDGITVIDTAIAESRAALNAEPDSEVAQESLFQALRRKVALLKQMLALINEMRQGNQDEAARIFSELNP